MLISFPFLSTVTSIVFTPFSPISSNALFLSPFISLLFIFINLSFDLIPCFSLLLPFSTAAILQFSSRYIPVTFVFTSVGFIVKSNVLFSLSIFIFKSSPFDFFNILSKSALLLIFLFLLYFHLMVYKHNL